MTALPHQVLDVVPAIAFAVPVVRREGRSQTGPTALFVEDLYLLVSRGEVDLYSALGSLPKMKPPIMMIAREGAGLLSADSNKAER